MAAITVPQAHDWLDARRLSDTLRPALFPGKFELRLFPAGWAAGDL
ncbi:MAG TPA: hypothetical protein VKY59_06015 [Spirillospora sp.]|nr:hypothetical protein [Spirillospora sp.]